MKLRVVNLRHEKADIRVCRPTPYGNPWKIYRDREKTKKQAHAFAVKLYRIWISKHPELITRLIADIKKFNGKKEITLGCWCVPLPCHANVLVENILRGLK